MRRDAPVSSEAGERRGCDGRPRLDPPDHRRIIDAGGRHPQLVGVGVGKRRWYATIFSFDSPRSRSISTERRSRPLSRAGFTPRSSSPRPLPCRPLVFTRADSSVFIPAVPPHVSCQCDAVYDNTHRLYGVPFKFDRNASAGLRVPRIARRGEGEPRRVVPGS